MPCSASGLHRHARTERLELETESLIHSSHYRLSCHLHSVFEDFFFFPNLDFANWLELFIRRGVHLRWH